MTFGDAYRGKRVFVTGHTGFKGSWLCEWLLGLEAEVHGYALEPHTRPSLFHQLGLGERLSRHEIADIRDLVSVRRAIDASRPDIVFHLAAQPLVRRSYAEPVETFATNIMGTVHLLEVVRQLGRPCAVVIVTSDKCYENIEVDHAYRECDALGGHDCYSASKAAAEIVSSAYRRSFFLCPDQGVRIATARAGNVIGGGDWAEDRIIPDCLRHLEKGEPIPVRNAHATRPWQHVLEPLGGYLRLGAHLLAGDTSREEKFPQASCAAFNFGPGPGTDRSVEELVRELLKHWPGAWRDTSDRTAPHEAGRLDLSIEKAREVLGWQPRWTFAHSVAVTVNWYHRARDCRVPADFQALTRGQIADYIRTSGDCHVKRSNPDS
jgi:CDP-glucose 4,6-dehydratase